MKADELAKQIYDAWINKTCIGDPAKDFVEIASGRIKEYGAHVKAEAVKNSERYKLRYQWLRDRVPDDLYYELGIILEFGDSGEIDGGIDAAIEKMEIK